MLLTFFCLLFLMSLASLALIPSNIPFPFMEQASNKGFIMKWPDGNVWTDGALMKINHGHRSSVLIIPTVPDHQGYSLKSFKPKKDSPPATIVCDYDSLVYIITEKSLESVHWRGHFELIRRLEMGNYDVILFDDRFDIASFYLMTTTNNLMDTISNINPYNVDRVISLDPEPLPPLFDVDLSSTNENVHNNTISDDKEDLMDPSFIKLLEEPFPPVPNLNTNVNSIKTTSDQYEYGSQVITRMFKDIYIFMNYEEERKCRLINTRTGKRTTKLLSKIKPCPEELLIPPSTNILLNGPFKYILKQNRVKLEVIYYDENGGELIDCFIISLNRFKSRSLKLECDRLGKISAPWSNVFPIEAKNVLSKDKQLIPQLIAKSKVK